MATLVFIRGWIHTGLHLMHVVKNLVMNELARSPMVGDLEGARYLQCWHFPSDEAIASDFVFLGATVNAIDLHIFRQLLEKIATEIVEIDGEDSYHIVGKIDVFHEGEANDQEWIISDGRLKTDGTRPRLIF